MRIQREIRAWAVSTSLGGTMAFGLTADWDAIPDIEILARGIERGVDALEAAAKARRSRSTAT